MFLTEFNQIRADIEHQNLSIPKFEIDKKTGKVTEPSIKGSDTMINEIDLYYNSTLGLVELLIAFYFGIEVSTSKPMLGLFERDEYDYSNLIYRFCILPRIEMSGMRIVY